MRVGIDLGTTYCAIAYVNPDNGKASVIKNSCGKSTTPSVLYFSPDGEILFGEEAKAYVEEGSERTANYFKYHMGDTGYQIYQNGKAYSAVDLSAELLKGIVGEAESLIGEKITDAVITVPAYFDHFQREATMQAGRAAGLTVLNIISEPTAAVFAYGINGKESNKTILVYDLGGGTFDVTIARITDTEIKVLGTDGDHHLGGKDWDDALANYLADQFMEDFDIDINSDIEMSITLQAIAENTKKQLTSKPKHTVTIMYRGNKGVYEITEENFEDITAYQLKRTKDIIQKLLGELQMNWPDIDGVLLVGGSTRMRQVKKYLTDICGRPPLGGVNVDEAVALGAAIRANINIEGKVRLGSAKKTVHDNVMQNETKIKIAGAKRIQDATSHSMGMIVENRDGTAFINKILIKKNTQIPAEVTKEDFMLSISSGTENHLDVYLLQGEEETLTWPLNCSVLGKYVFTGIESSGSQSEQVAVTYQYDENNIVQVSAKQVRNQKPLTLHIEAAEEDMEWVSGSPAERKRALGIKEIAVFLAVDLSGSMSGERLEEAKKAAVSFIMQFHMENTSIGIIDFADKSIVYQQLTKDADLLADKIRKWRIGADGLGYGNEAEPFSLTKSVLEKTEYDVKYLVVLTDGYWNNEQKAVLSAIECHRCGIEVIALGFGSANINFLDQIASKKDFSSFTDLSKLESALTGIAKLM